VPHDETRFAASWSDASAAELATAAGATDMFVFRRIAEQRFAHVGGAGRGAGWAGIVEISVDSEPIVARAISTRSIQRRLQPAPHRVLGPYYATNVAVIPVSDDVFVVFGASSDTDLRLSDQELQELATFASEGLLEVEPAKRLADEIEALNAVRDLLQSPAGSFEEALQRLVDHATEALSCDVGMAYVPDRDVTVVCDLRDTPPLSLEDARTALEHLVQGKTFPLCIQEVSDAELPRPFRSEDGVLAYYLLEIRAPLPGALLVLHTRAGEARGFTLLCQSLGVKLVDASEPLLAAGLLRDAMQEQLEHASAQARREPLTQVGNRLAWNEAIALTKPAPSAPVSIVKVDCRGLKRINDTSGHHAGDDLLKRVASILRSCSRDDDVVARVGGDEFGMVLPGADEQTAVRVVERIRREVVVARESGYELDLAIGHATTRDDDLEATDRRADQEMLQAKRTRRVLSR
jgi:diguanylate cyclase (GGDEF)-like protein